MLKKKSLLLDGDGEVELVLGLTDHVLRTYRWAKINQVCNYFVSNKDINILP